MRILITGVTGFVGGHLLPRLVERLGGEAAILGSGRKLSLKRPDGLDYEPADLLDQAALTKIVARFQPTVVLHLAGFASVNEANSGPGEAWRVNVQGLLNLIEAMRGVASGCTLYFASTGEIYGKSFLAGHALDETATPQPGNTYARTKLVGEHMLQDLLPETGARLVVLRSFNHIGPHQDERFVVASFAAQIARIEAGLAPPKLEVGNLMTSRDFLDVADVADAYIDLIEQSDRLADGVVFNVSSGIPRTIASILEDLRALSRVPFEVHIARERTRPSEIPFAAGDARLLRATTGWAPRVPWRQSMVQILEDARARLAIDRR